MYFLMAEEEEDQSQQQEEESTVPARKKWQEVEVTDPDGTVRIEERMYNKHGAYITKIKKGNAIQKLPRKRQIPELDILLAEILGLENKDGNTVAKRILAALAKKAVNGDIRAAELLLDRGYGKAQQNINVNKTEKQFIIIGSKKIEF